MAEDSTLRATGRTLDALAEELDDAGLSEASHKEIAAYFERVGVDSWWAQQLTVQYEQRFRGRPLGRTADGSFQIGASRTFPVSARRLWDFLLSPRGLALMLGEPDGAADSSGVQEPERLAGTGGGGIEYAMTTFKPYSHFRMRWKLPGWASHSILQVRAEEQGADPAKTTLTFHHEKLPDAAAREAMRDRWKAALDAVALSLR